MKYMFEELNKLTYETSQIYQLVRILILAITNDIQYQKNNEDSYYPLALAEIIENKLKVIPNKLDVLSLTVFNKQNK